MKYGSQIESLKVTVRTKMFHPILFTTDLQLSRKSNQHFNKHSKIKIFVLITNEFVRNTYKLYVYTVSLWLVRKTVETFLCHIQSKLRLLAIETDLLTVALVA